MGIAATFKKTFLKKTPEDQVAEAAKALESAADKVSKAESRYSAEPFEQHWTDVETARNEQDRARLAHEGARARLAAEQAEQAEAQRKAKVTRLERLRTELETVCQAEIDATVAADHAFAKANDAFEEALQRAHEQAVEMKRLCVDLGEKPPQILSITTHIRGRLNRARLDAAKANGRRGVPQAMRSVG